MLEGPSGRRTQTGEKTDSRLGRERRQKAGERRRGRWKVLASLPGPPRPCLVLHWVPIPVGWRQMLLSPWGLGADSVDDILNMLRVSCCGSLPLPRAFSQLWVLGKAGNTGVLMPPHPRLGSWELENNGPAPFPLRWVSEEIDASSSPL